jgi:hypothetical protein
MKGGAHQVAIDLREKHYHDLSNKKQRMEKEAHDRLKDIQRLEDENKMAKELKLKKKHDLKAIIDKDKNAKQQQKEIGSKMENRNDFENHNVLSYVYETKEHQSLKLGKKNEYLIGLI